MRRGQAELIPDLGRVILIILLMLLLSIQLGFFTNQRIENHKLEATILEQRLLTSFAPAGAPAGLVDPSRIDDASLLSALHALDERWGVRVFLYENRSALEQQHPLRDASLNQDALNLLPLARAGVKGTAEYWNLTLPVRIVGTERTAWLFMEVVRRA